MLLLRTPYNRLRRRVQSRYVGSIPIVDLLTLPAPFGRAVLWASLDPSEQQAVASYATYLRTHRIATVVGEAALHQIVAYTEVFRQAIGPDPELLALWRLVAGDLAAALDEALRTSDNEPVVIASDREDTVGLRASDIERLRTVTSRTYAAASMPRPPAAPVGRPRHP